MSDKTTLQNAVHNAINAYCDQEFDFSFDPANPVIRLHEPTFAADEINAAVDTLLSTFVTMGKQVKAFEADNAKYFHRQHCVMSNSGSSANLLAIAALANPATKDGLRPGDEVIVPALSWSTTVWPLIQQGLVPVFVDCDKDSFNFDLNKLADAIGPKTRAIMLVHVYGNPCDMNVVMDLVNKHNLHLIEDCCEAMGARFNDKPVGSFGEVGTFSYYFSHHITTLEGGICVSDNYEMTELMRILRAHGWSREAEQHQRYVDANPDIDPRFIFVNQGYNLRPTELQAAMGRHQLPKLDDIITKRRAIAKRYRDAFDKYGDFFDFQTETTGGEHVWFGFPLLVKPTAPFSVADITSHLHQQRIETRPIIAGNMAKHPAFGMYDHRIAGDIVSANEIMDQGFSIANHQSIDTKAQDYIFAAFDSFMQKLA